MKKRMTRNEYKEYMKECASRLWLNDGSEYTMAQYNKDCDSVEVIPLDLSMYPQLSENSIKYINILFDEEDKDRNGHYMLRGFTRMEGAEMSVLGLSYGDYGDAISYYAYNDDEMFVYTFCEGDTTLKIFDNKEDYEKEKADTRNWYKER